MKTLAFMSREQIGTILLGVGVTVIGGIHGPLECTQLVLYFSSFPLTWQPLKLFPPPPPTTTAAMGFRGLGDPSE